MVPTAVWIATIALIAGLLAFDYFFHVRKPHSPSLHEAAIWSAVYIGIALLFGVAVTVFGGAEMGSEYFAGYITEKALSVDNLFVFLIIITSFAVPRAEQQKVLLVGIVFSIFARTGFIFLGAALIQRFSWVFYIFGLILLITAGHQVKPDNEESHGDEASNPVIRLARKVLHTSDHYDEDKLFTVVDGKRVMTPMLLVMVAIGGTDILFALDSIPAIFGLTQSTFIVFTATTFSLMGLRQLFFLIDGLLDRLIYLSYGLAAILSFIGIKLILHALHENTIPLINDGESVPVIEITTTISLAVIIGVLVITVVASLLSPAGKAQAVGARVRNELSRYRKLETDATPERREHRYAVLVECSEKVDEVPDKYRKQLGDEAELRADMAQVMEAHNQWRAEQFDGPTEPIAGPPNTDQTVLPTDPVPASDGDTPRKQNNVRDNGHEQTPDAGNDDDSRTEKPPADHQEDDRA